LENIVVGDHSAQALDAPHLRAHVTGLLAAYGIPGATVGILHNGQITEFAAGVKDAATGEPATTDTVYQCGSMTKTWTALAFMQLVDEGKAALDQPMRTLLPGFKVADNDVTARLTPRQLLNHTNGIEEDYGDPGEDTDVYQRMVDNIAGAAQVHPLGRTHGYSAALGYAILARIMEVADGKPWDDIMRDRLFAPLGLTSTNSSHDQVDPGRIATGHIIRSLAEGPITTPVPYLPRAFGPGGNITSTAREVLTMAQVLLDHGRAPNGIQVVTPASVREMMHSRVPVPDPYMFGPTWALGLIVCDWHGQTVYASDGSTIGQNARLRVLPDSNLALVLLTNGGPRESFYKKIFNEILAGLGATTIPDLPAPDPALKLKLSSYVGAYARPGTRYEVTARDGHLYLTVFLNPMHARFLRKPDRREYELLPVSETQFLMPSRDPLEDTQTAAIYYFENGHAQYLHTNSRVHPLVRSLRLS
jgi:CubicO group peptidase (beta-lactamase class C family)